MVDVVGLILVLAVLAGGYYVIKSGVLNTIAQPAPIIPVATAPVGTEPAGTVPAGTTPAGTTPAPATDPLQALIDQLLGQGGSNTLPTTGGGAAPPPTQQPPIYEGNPAECQSRYNGKCDTECKSGNSSLCQSCQMACGGAAVGAVQTLPPIGGSTNPSLCKSKYNGKCDTECKSGNSSECSSCKQACGSFGARAYYVKTPTHPMTATVFRNNNYSYNANWDIGVQNAR